MIRRYSFGELLRDFNIGLDVFDDFWRKPSLTFSQGEFYNPDEFDLIPKKRHFEKLLKEKEQQLSNLEGIQKHYNEQHKKLREEIEELKKQINEKK